MSYTFIDIDGSIGEGGGQILRNAVVYSILLKTPIRIDNIRSGRKISGLRKQHLTGLNLAVDMSGACLEGGVIGSERITFNTSSTAIKNFSDTARVICAEIGSAGSICLLLQIACPCMIFQGKVILRLKGGTDTTFAPTLDYFQKVFLKVLSKQCFRDMIQVEINIHSRGYYPKGGGEIVFSLAKNDILPQSRSLPSITLTERGDISTFQIHCFYGGSVSCQIAEKMAKSAKDHLQSSHEFSNTNIVITIVRHERAFGSGSGILIIAETSTGCILGGSALGSPKEEPHITGKRAAEEIVRTLALGGCVDDWLQDQLILFMCLAEGCSQILTGSLTQHTVTAIAIAERMTGVKFHVEALGNPLLPMRLNQNGDLEGRHLISCQGIGFKISL